MSRIDIGIRAARAPYRGADGAVGPEPGAVSAATADEDVEDPQGRNTDEGSFRSIADRASS